MLNGRKYAQILRIYIPRIVARLNIRSPIFQDDNAPGDRPNFAEEEKVNLGLRFLPWPPYSPDLNPIEGIWSYWKDRIRRRTPQSIDELKRIAFQEWREIPLNIIRSFIQCMNKRLNDVITNKGDNTKY